VTRKALWIALVLLGASLAPLGLAQAPGGAGVQYTLKVDCPTTRARAGGFVSCPVRAVDDQDMMGDPAVAVDPLKPEDLIIASLHGGVHDGGAAGVTGSAGCPTGPSTKSRCGQEFTTFTSNDHGASWVDNPYVPPQDVGADAYGQHPGITIDPYGHVYVGSLYAMPKGNQRFDYVIAAQKFASLDTINQEQDGEYHTQYLDPVYKGNAIRQMWFLFDPATDNMTIVWNEQVQAPGGNTSEEPPNCLPLPPPAPCIPPPVGQSAAPAPPQGPTLAGEGRTSTDRPVGSNRSKDDGPTRSVIGVAWSTSSTKSPYHYQRTADAIGPCSTSTNPVLSDGWLYVGCVADPKEGPFPWHNQTARGTVELFRMDPSGGKPQYVGPAPLIGGTPKLGARSDGRLALVDAQAKDGMLSLDATYGQYDPAQGRVAWGDVQHYGSKAEKVDPARKLVEANVQSLIYREHSGVVQFILKEVILPSGVGLDSAKASVAPHIHKSIVAADESYGLLTKMDLDIGNPVNRTDPTLLQAPEMAYDDLSDDFLQLPIQGNYTYTDAQGTDTVLGPAYAREFFAVGDYGTVIFAEVIEITDLRGPAALPAPPPVPVAAPATSLNVSTVLLPAAGVSASGLLAAAFIANRRKDPMAAFAKHKK